MPWFNSLKKLIRPAFPIVLFGVFMLISANTAYACGWCAGSNQCSGNYHTVSDNSCNADTGHNCCVPNDPPPQQQQQQSSSSTPWCTGASGSDRGQCPGSWGYAWPGEGCSQTGPTSGRCCSPGTSCPTANYAPASSSNSNSNSSSGSCNPGQVYCAKDYPGLNCGSGMNLGKKCGENGAAQGVLESACNGYDACAPVASNGGSCVGRSDQSNPGAPQKYNGMFFVGCSGSSNCFCASLSSGNVVCNSDAGGVSCGATASTPATTTTSPAATNTSTTNNSPSNPGPSPTPPPTPAPVCNSTCTQNSQCPSGDTCYLGTGTPVVGNEPVYRLYNGSSNDHFYTASESEKSSVLASGGWGDEGVAFYGSATQVTGTVPVYRLFNHTHFYTTSEAEKNSTVASGGWSLEGVAFYAYPTQVPNTVPVYRLNRTAGGGHLFTSSAAQRSSVLASGGWSDEGVAFYTDASAIAGTIGYCRNPACTSATTCSCPAVAPVCVGVSISKSNPQVGDVVTFTCTQVTGVDHYKFQVKTPDGAIRGLTATGNVSQNYTIANAGAFTAQCTICTGAADSTCQAF